MWLYPCFIPYRANPENDIGWICAQKLSLSAINYGYCASAGMSVSTRRRLRLQVTLCFDTSRELYIFPCCFANIIISSVKGILGVELTWVWNLNSPWSSRFLITNGATTEWISQVLWIIRTSVVVSLTTHDDDGRFDVVGRHEKLNGTLKWSGTGDLCSFGLSTRAPGNKRYSNWVAIG